MSWWKSGLSLETGGKAKTVANSSVPGDEDDTGTTLIALKHKSDLIFAIDGLSSYDTGETYEVYDSNIQPLGDAMEIKAFWMLDEVFREKKKADVIALGGFHNGNRKLWAVETIENHQEAFEVIGDSYFGGFEAEIARNRFRNYTSTMPEDVVLNLIKNAMLDSSKEKRPNHVGKSVQRTGGMIYVFKITEKNEQNWKLKTHIEKLKKGKKKNKGCSEKLTGCISVSHLKRRSL